MAQWGNTDDAANSVLWATAQVNLPANTVNQAALFDNTTPSAFLNNGVAVQRTVGQFGLDATEIAVTNASVVAIEVINPGSGYFANATVTVGGNATANAQANATGYISTVNITASGNSYTTSPSVTIAAPGAQSFNANSAVATNGAISITSNKFQVNDVVTYAVATGNTALAGLTSGGSYYIQASNSTAVYLSTTRGGTAITLTKGLTETGHTLQGQTATAVATISGVSHGIAHTGWVLRTVGQGGRAGRVQYETLVAMGGNLSSDAEDTILKDA